MPKLKLKGYADFIEVGQDQARKINEIWEDKEVPNDRKISVANISVTKGDIRMIILDVDRTEAPSQTLIDQEKYYQRRQMLLSLSPADRAKENSWGLFNLVYWSAYNKLPPIIWKEDVAKRAEEFYVSSPEWSQVSVAYWLKSFKDKDKDFKNVLNKLAIHILENIEKAELADIKIDSENKERHNVLERHSTKEYLENHGL